MTQRPQFKFSRDDPQKHDLQLLASETASEAMLAQCTSLADLLPADLFPRALTDNERARLLRRLLVYILDNAFVRRETLGDPVAGDVLAAGAVMGLVTEPPSASVGGSPPSKMTKAV